jgi:uncharacterized protein (TIGR02145 family)
MTTGLLAQLSADGPAENYTFDHEPDDPSSDIFFLSGRSSELSGITGNALDFNGSEAINSLLDEGLIAYYPFNGNAKDESGNGNDGTIYNAIPVPDRFGNENGAYYFDSEKYMISDFEGVTGDQDRSISVWAKIDVDSAGGFISIYGGPGGKSYNTILGRQNAGVDISNQTFHYTRNSGNDEEWHHLVYVYSTTFGSSLNGFRVYEDGVLLTEKYVSYNDNVYNLNTTAANPYRIMADDHGSGLHLDDYRFYDRVLTESEISQIYNQEGIELVTDAEGNTYRTVQIGNQTWMAENLKTTLYADGEAIPMVSGNSDWSSLSTPGYCWYNNDEASYRDAYGALYNWYTVHTGKLCPAGWHVPTWDDWAVLEEFLISNGYNYDGSTSRNKFAKALAATHGWQIEARVGAVGNEMETNNTTGFTGLPAGTRYGDGQFAYFGTQTDWWTYDQDNIYSRTMRNYSEIFGSTMVGGESGKKLGYSVRCLKDQSTAIPYSLAVLGTETEEGHT